MRHEKLMQVVFEVSQERGTLVGIEEFHADWVQGA
jgi:hypothetical protein